MQLHTNARLNKTIHLKDNVKLQTLTWISAKLNTYTHTHNHAATHTCVFLNKTIHREPHLKIQTLK